MRWSHDLLERETNDSKHVRRDEAPEDYVTKAQSRGLVS